MKKIRLLISTFIIFFFGVTITHAASLNISANKSTVVVGSNVTITVNASGAAGWEYCLNYDKSIFSLSSTTSDTGGTCVLTGSTLIGYSKVTFTLTAIKSGSSTITVDSAAMYNDDGNEIQFSKGSVNVTAKTQAEIEASYSNNADLKELSITDYELSPAFDKNTTNYTLEVPNEVESIVINATKADVHSTVTGAGEKPLTEGINKFEIVVTAEKGNKKTYTIEVTRQELNPINVKVGGEDLTVVRKADALEVPSYYTLSEVIINDETVPALKSDITGFILVGLKNSNGDINLYIYNENQNSYTTYKQLGMEGFTFISLTPENLVEGYSNVKQIDINGISVDSYIGREQGDIVLVYGMNAKTGETSWYKYDTKEGTFQRYADFTSADTKKNSDLYFTLTIVFAAISALTIILILVLMINNSNIRKKNDKLIEILEKNRKPLPEDINKEEESSSKEEKSTNEPEEKSENLESNEKKEPKSKTKEQEVPKPTETISDKKETMKIELDSLKEEIDKSQLSQRELRRLEKQQEAEKKNQIETEPKNKIEEKTDEVVDNNKDKTDKESKKTKKEKLKNTKDNNNQEEKK